MTTPSPAPAEALVSRTVDGEATDAQFDQLCTVADARAALGDAALWRALALAYRDDQRLRLAARELVQRPFARTELADAEGAAAARLDTDALLPTQHAGAAHARWSSRAGWGVALAASLLMAVAWLRPVANMQGQPAPNASMPTQAAGVGAGLSTAGLGQAIGSAADALDAYLARGRAEGSVVGESEQRQVLSVLPRTDGSYDVIYVRPIIERVQVQDLYKLGIDDTGSYQPVRMPARHGM